MAHYPGLSPNASELETLLREEDVAPELQHRVDSNGDWVSRVVLLGSDGASRTLPGGWYVRLQEHPEGADRGGYVVVCCHEQSDDYLLWDPVNGCWDVNNY